MTEIRYLEPMEIVAERPFTHPSHTTNDLSALRYMIDQLCLLLSEPGRYAQQPPPVTLYQSEANGRQHRFVMAQPEQLQIPNRPLTVVGFFGQKRKRISVSLTPLMAAMDQALREEFPNHPELFSYSTLELADEDCGNLVLFAHDAAIDYWGRSQAHMRAVYELSPSYYDSVRLYNGRLPLGLMVSNLLHLSRIKYYDYSSVPLWRAVREIVAVS
jgi:hypothetical protein